jgi:hypothetical protein
MIQDKVIKDYTTQVSDSFDRIDDQCIYEPGFRRWLVREIEGQKLTLAQALERFNFHPQNGFNLVRSWREKYAPSLVLSLPYMTAAEKQLEDAKMKNIALNMLIDVAEEKLKIGVIDIRPLRKFVF